MFLVAYPLTPLARDGVSLLHDCCGCLPCDASHIAAFRVHPRVVKAERPAEAPNLRRGCRKFRRKRRRLDAPPERETRSELCTKTVSWNPGQIAEQRVSLELAFLSTLGPILDDVQIA